MEKKSISFIIEQGMILLDKVRLLSSTISINIYSNQQQSIYHIKKQFKRWIDL